MSDSMLINKQLYVFAPRTDRLFETMLAALTDKGYTLDRLKNLTEDYQGFCLVYITDELIDLFGGADAANEYFSNSSLEFIPVISDESSGKQKKILTQYFYTPLEQESIGRYIRRIDLLISMGSKQLKDWNRIRSLAVNWNANGRSGKFLLSKADFALANDLLRHPIHELLSESEALIRAIVSDTQKQLKRRNRIILTTGFSIGIAFLISGIFAFISKKRSDDAALLARIQTNSTAADRLSAKALELMDSDPDLPWILMDTALSISETQESMDAAHEISDNLIEHKSFQLPSAASSLGYLGNNIYAIGFTDGRGISVMDTSSGDIFYSDPATDNGWTCYVSVSPHKNFFAADYSSDSGTPGGTKFYRWINGAVEYVSSAEIPIESFAWSGEENIIAVADHKIYGIDILTGRSENNLSIDLEGLPIAVTSDEDTGNLFAALDNDGTLSIAVYSLPKKKVIGNVPIDGFGQMHYDHVTKTLLVDTGVSAVLIDIAKIDRGDDADVAEVQISFARTLNALTSDQNGSFYFGSKTGSIFVLKPCNSKPLEVVFDASNHGDASYWPYASGFTDVPQSAVVAHLSDVHDVITVEDGKWATVGRDAMLRIWNRPVYEKMSVALEIQPGNYAARSPGRENAIRISLGSVNNSTAAAMSADGFSRIIFDRNTLKTVRNDYGWILGQAKVAYDTGDVVVVHGLQSGYAFSLVPASSGIEKFKNASKTASVHWLYSLLEISQEGGTVFGVLPDGSERGTYCIRRVDSEDDELGKLETTSNMIYLKPLDNSDAMAINSEGEVFWFSGRQESLFADPIALTASTHISDNRFLSLDIEGNLWLNEDFGDAHIIGYFAPSNEGFAIRISSSGRLAAVIGDFETRVFDIETGEVTAVLNNLFSQYSEHDSASVHDVLFDLDDSGMVLVYSNGWISRLDFMEDEDVSVFIHENCPRQFSEDESAMLTIPD